MPSSEPGHWRRDRAALEEAEATLASFRRCWGRPADDELSGLYARLNLDEGAEEALRPLIDRHDDYEAAVEAERTARTTLEAERRQLRWCEGYEAWMEEATAADLEQEREAARADAAQEEAHLEEISSGMWRRRGRKVRSSSCGPSTGGRAPNWPTTGTETTTGRSAK